MTPFITILTAHLSVCVCVFCRGDLSGTLPNCTKLPVYVRDSQNLLVEKEVGGLKSMLLPYDWGFHLLKVKIDGTDTKR